MSNSTPTVETNSSGEIEPVELEIGSIAADFRLPSSQGGEISLSDYRGKSHVVLFFVREFI